MWFRIPSPPVTHETLDGEAIIVNFMSGIYYSTDGSGAAIWSALEQGASQEDIVTAFSAARPSSGNALEEAVSAFIEELRAEGLILPVEQQPIRGDLPVPLALTLGQNDPDYPVLHKYTDMQDMLLLDPIHEVTEQGWPFTEP